MIEFSNDIQINRNIEEVFDFLSDFENIPKWNYYVQNVFKTREGPVESGAVYYQKRKSDEQVFKITEYQHNEKITIETLSSSYPYFLREMHFEKENGSTQIHDRWRLKTKIPHVIEKLLRPRIRSATRQNLNKLKILLETRKVTLKNGKTIHI